MEFSNWISPKRLSEGNLRRNPPKELPEGPHEKQALTEWFVSAKASIDSKRSRGIS